MFVFILPRAYGRIDEADGAYVVTEFTCVNLLPIVPHGSRLVMARDDGGETAIAIRPHARSIAVGYARAWAIAALLAGLALGVSRPGAGIALAVACAAILVASFAIARPTTRRRALRERYRVVTGLPVDPALLPEERRGPLRARLEAELAERAPSLGRATYRSAPPTSWRDVALDPAVTDESFLDAALVLARLDTLEPDARSRGAGAIHDAIGSRILRVRSSIRSA